MIIETIFTTLNEAGEPNFAPMGIEWGEESVIVRPFRTSLTYRNLLLDGHGVANLCDNVMAYVKCALYDETLLSFPSVRIRGAVCRDACSWLELEVVRGGGSVERAEFQCRIVYKGQHREFLGFCRAKNAVIEATILATRLDFNGPNKALDFLNQYMKVVENTGSEMDKKAFRLVLEYVKNRGSND